MKETTEFYHRIKGERDAQEKRVDMERQEVERRFEAVADVMVKKHKKDVERLEQLQIQQFKAKAKNLKSEQVRECRGWGSFWLPTLLAVWDFRTHYVHTIFLVCSVVPCLQVKLFKHYKEQQKEEEKTSLKKVLKLLCIEEQGRQCV